MASNLPLWKELPQIAFWLLPTGLGYRLASARNGPDTFWRMSVGLPKPTLAATKAGLMLWSSASGIVSGVRGTPQPNELAVWETASVAESRTWLTYLCQL